MSTCCMKGSHNKIISIPCNSDHLKFLRVGTGNKSRISFSKAFTIHKLYKKMFDKCLEIRGKTPHFCILHVSFFAWAGNQWIFNSLITLQHLSEYREATQSVCVTDCYFTVNVLDLPFASFYYRNISLNMYIKLSNVK